MRSICYEKGYNIEDFPWWDFCSWISYIQNMTVCPKTGLPPWKLRRMTEIIDLPQLLTNIDKALRDPKFHHRDYNEFLSIQRASLRHIKRIARKNWGKYINKKAEQYWRKLNRRQRRKLKKRPLSLRSKVLVRDYSKSGISPNKLLTRKTGPWTVVGRSINNNAYIVKNDISGRTETVGLRRIRLIHPHRGAENSNGPRNNSNTELVQQDP